ncbi:DUF4870 domain-containing protein [Pedobacter endophyticus]|uniref:DUF4870 domain-containing protein n=1 Tax=Pedobacter endophyticus TaxID=2789740 RepID=A0A7S9Q0I5_9SPHI|nr:DUF4870 domain-containing protein [Pedobacter endophyticus]QPH41015.1 DUF4870 domain-containing protein [Pedobacter endophyticus]
METNTPLKSTDNGKMAAIVSYITVFGWLISYFALYKGKKTSLSTYHLRQSLLLHLATFVIWGALSVIGTILAAGIIAYLGYAFSIVSLIYIVLGILIANNSQQRPLPFMGESAQKMFSTI